MRLINDFLVRTGQQPNGQGVLCVCVCCVQILVEEGGAHLPTLYYTAQLASSPGSSQLFSLAGKKRERAW